MSLLSLKFLLSANSFSYKNGVSLQNICDIAHSPQNSICSQKGFWQLGAHTQNNCTARILFLTGF